MTNDERLRFVPRTAHPAAPLLERVPAPPRPDAGTDPMDADIEALTKAIRVIAQAIDTRSKAIARASGLTIPQIVVLQAVRVRGEVTTSLLSRHCHLSAGTVVSILDKLEERGFVERYRNVADRRIVHTRLTAAGDAALAAAPTLLPPPALEALAGLAPREREVLVASFRTVAGLLRGHAGEPEE
ncbi:MAG: MarR family winged helix-turn-helix transcriptional regulator [Salinarimonas sp.]